MSSRIVRNYLKWFRAYRKYGLQTSKYFLPRSYARASFWMQKLGMLFGLEALGFTSHSLRRGGATQLLLQRASVEEIMIFGGWAKLSSCREYLRKG